MEDPEEVTNTATWDETARAFVLDYVRSPDVVEFTANDLWRAGLPVPADRRHLNRVLLGLKREGAIVSTDRKVPSVRGGGVLIRVWEVAP